MYYIARDGQGNLIDHTLSDSQLTTRLAALRYQMKMAQQRLQTMTRSQLVAFDYPVAVVKTVSLDQYQRARAKDMQHFKRLLVPTMKG